MTHNFDLAKQHLLEPAGLSLAKLDKILGSVLGHQVDWADLYFQNACYESWYLEDGIVKDGSSGIASGVGVRAISEDKTGFAYSDDIEMQALESAAKNAGSIAKLGHSNTMSPLKVPSVSQNLYLAKNPMQSLNEADKIALLHKVDAYVRGKNPQVVEVMVSLAANYEHIVVAASDGTFNGDVRPLVRLNVEVIVEKNSRRERGSAGGGGRFTYDEFSKQNLWQEYADNALHIALTNLEAIDAPAGTMPVVLGPGWPGVLLHEAIGHGLEGDFNRKKTSAFSGRIGERVASPLCTIVDDGTLANRRGSLNMDDEGVTTNCTTLIENGILKNYMQDKLNAKLMNMQPTGNGRRESYAHTVMPRMTNTYMLAGSSEPEEIIQSVKKGIYAVNFGGGSVDITSGKFVFSANEAYLIENGKITTPVKGATLIGNGPQVLTKVSMCGNDLKLDNGVGVCGKDGQSVPVGVGQPTLKVDELTVGGTKV